MSVSNLRELLELGVNSGASDWHIREETAATIRIAGDLVETDFVTDKQFLQGIMKTMATADMIEKFRVAGDLDLSYVEDGIGRFRVNIHRQRGMLGMSMRHVKSKIANFEELGLPKENIETIASSERGIIILSGTTGSGKSTTLASMIQHINLTSRKHIVTIEDPIEYEFHDAKSIVEQREVGLDTETFRSALIHVLRQDPDIIMVGEMRNGESFDAGLQASDTGHLVMTTLHSTNAYQAVNRILDFYRFEEQQAIRSALAVNLRAVICQRLIPRAYGGGVIPAVEIMVNSPIVRKLIETNKLEKLPSAIESGRQDGMQSFNQSLLKLVNEGIITEEDALKSSNNAESLKMNLKGIFLDTSAQIIGE